VPENFDAPDGSVLSRDLRGPLSLLRGELICSEASHMTDVGSLLEVPFSDKN
jgi:hypothetical protein